MINEYGKNDVRNRRVLRGALIAIIGILLVLVIVRIAPLAHRIVILPVRRVQIYGNLHLTKGEVVRGMGIDVSSSILTFSKKNAKEALLADRRINDVEITKIYPDTLRIYTREKAALSVVSAKETAYWVSADGVFLSEVKEKDVIEHYPLVTLKTNNVDIKIGERVSDFYVLDILTALRRIQEEYPDFFSRLSSFTVDTEGVRLHLSDGTFGVWLGSNVTQQKLESLRALLVVLKSERSKLQDGDLAEGMMEIDMSATHAAVRMREMNNEP